jgi:hypothetical protein
MHNMRGIVEYSPPNENSPLVQVRTRVLAIDHIGQHVRIFGYMNPIENLQFINIHIISGAINCRSVKVEPLGCKFKTHCIHYIWTKNNRSGVSKRRERRRQFLMTGKGMR